MKITEENQEKLSVLEKIANGIIWWVGSIQSLVFHTIFFIICFALPIFNVVEFEHMLLVLTTIVSLEAIYLAIFIQMSVNKSSEHIEDLKEDVNEIQEDIDEIQEDIEEIVDEDEVNEKVEKTLLKSNISNNTNEINALKNKILELQHELETLKKNR